jgi:molecular chaperone DnaJ
VSRLGASIRRRQYLLARLRYLNWRRTLEGATHSMSERNYYDVLGISPGADGTTVNRAYWQLARNTRTGSVDPRSHTMLDELNEAYTTLETPMRGAYDADVTLRIRAERAAKEEAAT